MPNEETQEEPQPSRKSSKILILVALVLLIAGGGTAAVLLRRPRPVAAQAPSAAKDNVVLHLDPFTVNLSDPTQASFLRVGIDLGLSHEVKDSAPISQMRDAVLNVLMSTKPDELAAPDGKQNLKARILHALQERAPELGVEDVYYTEFLVQR